MMGVDGLTIAGAAVPTSGRRREMAVAFAALVLGWAAWAVVHSLRLHGSGVPIDWVGLAFVWSGLALALTGLFAWAAGNNASTGALIALCGFLFLVPSLTVLRQPFLWTVGAILASSSTVVLAYLVLAFPTGRVTGWAPWLAIAAVTVKAVASGPAIAPFSLPQDYGCTGCPASTNLVYLHGQEALGLTLNDWFSRLGLIASGLLIAVLLWRFAASTAPARRVLAPVYLAVTVYALCEMELQALILLRELVALRSE